MAEVLDPDEHITPVTYNNSAADLKAFCGEHGGIVCTSTNAREILQWSLARREKVLFFPDQHLGRNTAKALGVPLEQMPMWNPRKELGGNGEQALLVYDKLADRNTRAAVGKLVGEHTGAVERAQMDDGRTRFQCAEEGERVVERVRQQQRRTVVCAVHAGARCL